MFRSARAALSWLAVIMNDVSPIPGETCLYRMNYRFKHQFTGTAYQIGFLAAAAQIVCQDSAKSVFISIKKSHLTLRFLTQADVHSITAHYANDRFAPITANRELIRFLPN